MQSQLAPQIEQFIHDNPQGVMTSFRRNGMPQLSIVTVYPRDGGVGVSITENRAKFKNLLRDPRCSLLISHADWWSGFLVFEGKVELSHSGNTDPEKLRMARRYIFSVTTRRRSADWDESDAFYLSVEMAVNASSSIHQVNDQPKDLDRRELGEDAGLHLALHESPRGGTGPGPRRWPRP